MRRRDILRNTCVLVGVTGAGCLGTGRESSNSETNNSEPEQQNQESETEQSPSDTVQRYFEAIDSGDLETAQSQIHPDGPLSANDVDTVNLTVNELEVQSVRQVVRNQTGVESEEDLDNATTERQRQLDELTAEMGFDQTAYVFFSVEYSSSTEQGYFLLVKDDTWKIWM